MEKRVLIETVQEHTATTEAPLLKIDVIELKAKMKVISVSGSVEAAVYLGDQGYSQVAPGFEIINNTMLVLSPGSTATLESSEETIEFSAAPEARHVIFKVQ